MSGCLRPTTSSPRVIPVRGPAIALVAALAALLSACATPDHRAPVEDRSGRVRTVPAPPLPGAPGAAPPVPAATGSAAAPVATPEPVKLPPGAENAGKPGYYTVKRGDTLYAIGLESGQGYRDIARWNSLDNPNLIEVGQVLRVVPPAAAAGAAVTRPVAPGGRVETRPLPVSPGSPASPAPGTAPASTAAPAASAANVGAAVAGPITPAAAPPAPGPAVAEGEDGLGWAWPAAGAVVAPFEENKTKGLAIAGKAGDPVLAAADGRVVYAGSGLRGYGNLVIVKHNATFLSAYAHNQTLLVKEDQIVRRGQKIAEMGSTDAERVQLHFEIRRQGKPIDPARLLPPR